MTESSHIAREVTAPADDAHAKTGVSAPSKPPQKLRRTLTPDNIVRTVTNFVVVLPTLVRASIRPKIPFVLREKVCLAVTSINDCRFCQWGHTHWALAHGISLEEVNRILGHEGTVDRRCDGFG